MRIKNTSLIKGIVGLWKQSVILIGGLLILWPVEDAVENDTDSHSVTVKVHQMSEVVIDVTNAMLSMVLSSVDPEHHITEGYLESDVRGRINTGMEKITFSPTSGSKDFEFDLKVLNRSSDRPTVLIRDLSSFPFLLKCEMDTVVFTITEIF